jgi:hypothetical protein
VRVREGDRHALDAEDEPTLAVRPTNLPRSDRARHARPNRVRD